MENSEQPEPVDVEDVVCEGTWVYDSRSNFAGKCSRCYEKVDSSPGEITSPNGYVSKVLIPVPHTRKLYTYVISDISDCSCGGVHGDLGEVTRVSCLREKLAVGETAKCGKCGKAWSEHKCP